MGVEVCAKAYHGDIPDLWLKRAILPFPKKGDLGSASNYRGITLLAVGAKFCNRMLHDRLRPHTDPKLRNGQNGFRNGRSTVAERLALRRLVERITSKNLPASITFVDFRKTFDSTYRGKLMELLGAYSVAVQNVDKST